MDDQLTSPASETENKARALYMCPHEGCGKAFKDLKTHMLTHNTERPEKCPMRNCEYNKKGFARKYDRNRHVLTHFKGTMLCGFCPEGTDSTEITFHRPDTFKRHLTTVHGAELTASAAGRAPELHNPRTPSSAKCSICAQYFSSVHAFFDHLDECVLQTLQHEDEGEAINMMRLAEVEDDEDVIATLERNNLPTKTAALDLDNNSDSSDENIDPDASDIVVTGSSKKKKKGVSHGIQKSSSTGRPRAGSSNIKFRSRKPNVKSYPPAWGFHPSMMTMRHRVLKVYDGPRRLVKDDMMLSNTDEVRLKLSDERYYTTDLDVQTLRRAEAFLNATEEEKGPWIRGKSATDSEDPNYGSHDQVQEYG